jgi:eukaryotic-like serine/threonine-protein kinase
MKADSKRMALLPGTVLNHYRIVGELGAGGMGVVYEAEDTRLQRRVALKVLPTTASEDPSRYVRFEREAQALASLNHPNIVTIYSVEECEAVVSSRWNGSKGTRSIA